MITLLLLLIMASIIGLVILVFGGLLYLLWPLAVVLVLGLLIDILVVKGLIKKHKK